MKNQLEIKEALYKQCIAYVNKRKQTVEEIIKSNQKGLLSETKSSAGDKHETGRAMLQLEMEKASQQLSVIAKMEATLARIEYKKITKLAHLGSVVTTNKAVFFLSISCGELIINNKSYFAVSVSSPIGKMLLGKQTGDFFSFNTIKQEIKEIF